jgi:peroxiredoxin
MVAEAPGAEGTGGARAACEISGQLSQLVSPDPQALIAGLVGAPMVKTSLRWTDDHPDVPLGPFARRNLATLASRHTLLVYLTPAEARDDDLGVETMGCAYRDYYDAFHDLGVLVVGVGTQPLGEQHEIASAELYPQALLCDEHLVLARALGLPVTIHAAKVEYQPIVLIAKDGRIAHVIYPISSPRLSAKAAIDWLIDTSKVADTASDIPPDTRESER